MSGSPACSQICPPGHKLPAGRVLGARFFPFGDDFFVFLTPSSALLPPFFGGGFPD